MIVRVSVDQGGAGTTILHGGIAGYYCYLIGAMLTMDIAGTAQFTTLSNAANSQALTGVFNLGITGGFVLPTSKVPYLRSALEGGSITLITATGQANGVVVLAFSPEEDYVLA